MSREQIEEMAKYCPCYFGEKCCIDGELPEKCDMLCQFGTYAEILYNAGYRKQEWISVEERLPIEEEYRDESRELIPLLVCEKDTRYPYRAMYDGKEWGDGLMKIRGITHWMPLPIPPKGGE